MIQSTFYLLIELLILFFTVALLVQLLQRRIGAARLQKWMGGSPLAAAIKGIIVGFVTPFCTYSAIPMLVGMRQAGVPTAGYVAFIVAAPVLDPVLFGALAIIVGLEIAIIYAFIVFVAALGLALLAEAIDITAQLKPIAIAKLTLGSDKHCENPDNVSDQQTGCSTVVVEEPWRNLPTELHHAVVAATALLKSVAPLLAVGVLLGIVITLFLSPQTVADVTAKAGPFAIPIAAGIGTPIYTSTAMLVPIADSLTFVGVGSGAIVALTIAGAGANLPEFVLLTRFFKVPIICIFFLYVFFVAVIGGFLTQSIMS